MSRYYGRDILVYLGCLLNDDMAKMNEGMNRGDVISSLGCVEEGTEEYSSGIEELRRRLDSVEKMVEPLLEIYGEKYSLIGYVETYSTRTLPAPEIREEARETLTHETEFTPKEVERIFSIAADASLGMYNRKTADRLPTIKSKENISYRMMREYGREAKIGFRDIKYATDIVFNERGEQEVGKGLEGKVGLSPSERKKLSNRAIYLSGAAAVVQIIAFDLAGTGEYIPEMIQAIGMISSIPVTQLGGWRFLDGYFTRRALNEKRKELPVSGVGGAG